MSSMVYQRQTVTPEIAVAWLGKNKNFRKLNERRATDLARAIATGRWELTNDAIAFDAEGALINGQHRLRACVIAKKPIDVLVIRGLVSDTFVDLGSKRTMGQLFTNRGMGASNALPSVARMMWFHEGPGIKAYFVSHSADRKTLIQPDNGEILMTAERHPGLVDSLAVCGQLRKLAPHATFAFLHYLIAQQDRAEADLFIYALASGDGLSKTDAAYWLRERLIGLRGRFGHSSTRFEVFKLSVKAWNRWITRTPCKLLQVRDNEDLEKIEGPVRARA